MSEALRRAAEAVCKTWFDGSPVDDLDPMNSPMDVLEAALAEHDEQPEPKHWLVTDLADTTWYGLHNEEPDLLSEDMVAVPLYTTPPAPKRLSDDEIERIRCRLDDELCCPECGKQDSHFSPSEGEYRCHLCDTWYDEVSDITFANAIMDAMLEKAVRGG
jgi:hypothetical protein